MIEKIKEDILSELNDAIVLIEKKRYEDLLELSNHTIHCASIFQDDDSISIAVLMYALYKVFMRDEMVRNDKILKGLKDAVSALNERKWSSYKKNIQALFKLISAMDDKLKLYIEEVITKARIKKGSALVEHGISLGRAAEIMGVSQWELMSYVGKTEMLDKEKGESQKGDTITKRRLKKARELFR